MGERPTRVRVAVRVKPRSRLDRVGGRWGEGNVLLVAVRAPASNGKANAAVVDVLATAFGVAQLHVAVVSGHRSRSKLVEISGHHGVIQAKLQELLSRS